jgi:5-methyltetrahydrofolate--homocysteine methyltransferase
MSDLRMIMESLIAGNAEEVNRLVRKGLEAQVPAKAILNEALIPGMDVVGKRMGSGEMFIPEVLQCAEVMSQGLDILKPHLGDGETSSVGKVIIGTVKGDVHNIGKNLVIMMLESVGFDVHDLGVDVSVNRFVESVQEEKPDLLALSALLTSTLPMMKETVEALSESGIRETVKIMVGGAPVSQDFANKIRADGYAPDAGSASILAKKLVSDVRCIVRKK